MTQANCANLHSPDTWKHYIWFLSKCLNKSILKYHIFYCLALKRSIPASQIETLNELSQWNRWFLYCSRIIWSYIDFLNSLYNVSGKTEKLILTLDDRLFGFVSLHVYDWQFVFLRKESRMMWRGGHTPRGKVQHIFLGHRVFPSEN